MSPTNNKLTRLWGAGVGDTSLSKVSALMEEQVKGACKHHKNQENLFEHQEMYKLVELIFGMLNWAFPFLCRTTEMTNCVGE